MKDKMKHFNRYQSDSWISTPFSLLTLRNRVFFLLFTTLSSVSLLYQCSINEHTLEYDLSFGNVCDAAIMGGDDDEDGECNLHDVDNNNNGLIDIGNALQLNNMRYNLAGTHYNNGIDPETNAGCPVADGESEPVCHGYELINDIELSTPWVPIGSGVCDEANVEKFAAEFNGNDHNISNMLIVSDAKQVGFFGVSSSTIQNFKLSDSSVNVASNEMDYKIGAVVGELCSDASLINVSSSNVNVFVSTNSGSEASIGGLVGENSGKINNISANGTVKGPYTNTNTSGTLIYTGGLVGYHSSGVITNSSARVDVFDRGTSDFTSTTSYFGGLVGYSNSGIRNSYATGNISGGDGPGITNYLGGLIGRNASSGELLHSYAIGNVKGGAGANNIAGALIGSNSAIIDYTYATGNVDGGGSAAGDIGGLIGATTGTVSATTNYHTGTVTNTNGGTANNIGGASISLGQLSSQRDNEDSVVASRVWDIMNWDVGAAKDVTTIWDPTHGHLPTLRSYKEDESGNQIEGADVLCYQPDSKFYTRVSCESNIDGGNDYDGDGIIDSKDNCPSRAGWVASRDNDYDADGCKDDYYDDDDDNDGRPDVDDNCPLSVSLNGWDDDLSSWNSLEPSDDNDGDGCEDDSTEDPDDDNDGILDYNDICTDQLSWPSTIVNDGDQDGCHDEGVGIQGDVVYIVADDDDDNDRILDGDDNCQYVVNPDQSNNDNDLEPDDGKFGDFCDSDDDNDDIPDDSDNCQFIANGLDQEDIVGVGNQDNDDGDDDGNACDDDDDNDGRNDCGADNDCSTNNAGTLNANDNCQFIANINQNDYDSNGKGDACEDVDGDGEFDADDVDVDGDGLIEIETLAELRYIRNNLGGSAYNNGVDPANTNGCGGVDDDMGNPINSCFGYELGRNDKIDINIYLPGNWEPVGTSSDPFTGTFEGNGNNINSMTISSPAKHVGFFGYVEGGTIRNLKIGDQLSQSVTSTNIGNNVATGSLAGYIDEDSTVENVSVIRMTVEITTTGNNQYTGVLVGYNDGGTITNSSVMGDVTGGAGASAYVGGLVGWSEDGTITNSSARSNVTGGAGDNNRIGGLVGQNTNGEITNSYATGDTDGGAGDNDRVGGLVGWNEAGEITNSYATGDTDGGAGNNDRVGGLVGWNEAGGITNSYATGSAIGRAGTYDYVGGLVGYNDNSSIANSYATGSASGGGGDSDYVGGLAGFNTGTGTIRNSYATGSASGGGGVGDYAGRLVGNNTGTIENTSYANSEATVDAEHAGASGTTKSLAELKALTVVDLGWSDNDWVKGAGLWPALKDISTTTDTDDILCNQPTSKYYQREQCLGDDQDDDDDNIDDINDNCPFVNSNDQNDIDGDHYGDVCDYDDDNDGTLDYGDDGVDDPDTTDSDDDNCPIHFNPSQANNDRALELADRNLQIKGDTCDDDDDNDGWNDCGADNDCSTNDAGTVNAHDNCQYIANSDQEDSDSNGKGDVCEGIDSDGDGLIEIDNITKLNNMRYNLAGTSYKTSGSATPETSGCPSDVCSGYELTNDIVLPSSDWDPVGTSSDPFTGIFEGNGYTISNLSIDSTAVDAGFFGVVAGTDAEIRNVAVVASSDGVKASNSVGSNVGALVGNLKSGGEIKNSYVMSDVSGGAGTDSVGGLVGNNAGTITNAYAMGYADVRDGVDSVSGGAGNDDVGGLVGNNSGTITKSYTTAERVDGEDGTDSVGGLAGDNSGTITKSYSTTGSIDGGAGTGDDAGRLVGDNTGTIESTSYANSEATVDAENVGVSGTPKSLAELKALAVADLGWSTNDWEKGTGNWPALKNSVSPNELICQQPSSYYYPRSQCSGENDDDGDGKFDSADRCPSPMSNGGNSWNSNFSTDNDDDGCRDITEDLDDDNDGWNDCGADDDCSTNEAGTVNAHDNCQFIANTDQLNNDRALEDAGDLDVEGDACDDDDDNDGWNDCGADNDCSTNEAGTVNAHDNCQYVANNDQKNSDEAEELAADLPLEGDVCEDVDGDKIIDSLDVDIDGDGLIEIKTATELGYIRNDLDGSHYDNGVDPANANGCGGADDGTGTIIDSCFGYELAADINLSGIDWDPIGDVNNPFTGTFDGNMRAISSLAIDSSNKHVGFFGYAAASTIRNLIISSGSSVISANTPDNAATGALAGYINSATVDNVSIIDVNLSINSDTGDEQYAGGLIGSSENGTITDSTTTGDVTGGAGSDRIGGLVGYNDGGTITNSSAMGDVSGGVGDEDKVGGLVGHNSSGTITDSNATGDVNLGKISGALVGLSDNSATITYSFARGKVKASAENGARTGGLVAYNYNSEISNSYAVGRVYMTDGGPGVKGKIGGLVGENGGTSTITNAYATGHVIGRDGDGDDVGGLVGHNNGASTSITATYATGHTYDRDGTGDNVGALVGRNTGTITDSYKNSDASIFGGENDDDNDTNGTRKTLFELMSLSLTDAGTSWTNNNWDMGDETELPTLANSNGSVAGNFCNQPVSSSQSRVLCPDDEPDDDGDGIADVADACPFKAVLEGGTDSNSDGCDDVITDEDGDGLTEEEGDIDKDNDGLIEIGVENRDLEHIKHNLAGTSHKTSATDSGNNTGCPSTGCNGYELREDITLTDDWTPVGTSSDPFTGNFDGNGHTISNLTINSSVKNVGFFGFVSARTIRNLIINGGSVTSTSTANYASTGALAGNISSATVDNVSIIGVSVTGGDGDGVRIGDLVGFNDGEAITNSYATGDVTGGTGDDVRIGGLVGFNSGGAITNSYATGSADGGAGNYDHVGGLAGYNEGTITNSYATGSASGGAGGDDRVGGLVGNSSGYITNSYATGSASGGDGAGDYVGGLVGYNKSSGTIENSYATGDVDGGEGTHDYVGGLVGVSGTGSTITNSYATGSASGGAGGDDRVGGLVGYNKSSGTIENSYATGDVTGGAGDSDYVGGLVGYNNSSGVITNSYATGSADGGDGAGDYVGGLAGVNLGTITNSYATGSASGGDGRGDSVGGLVGASGTGSTITNSYATGSADGGDGDGDRVGGLVGFNFKGEITNSYATGDVDGGEGNSDYVGGLVGYNKSSGTITNSYATGSASGGAGTGNYAGRLVGNSSGTITNSYANSEAEADAENTVASGASGVSDGTSKTLTELRELDFSTLGWSSDDWENMDAASNVLWPALKDSVSSELLCNQPTSRYYHRPQCLDEDGNPTDPDDDADGIADVADACPYASGWMSNETNDVDQDGCQNSKDLDDNNNGLIEIGSGGNVYLGHIRHNLAGTSHKTSATDSDNRTGCPITGCNGYELRKDITLTADWTPVGDDSTPFTGNFDGNGHTISNLTINSSNKYVGFFGYVSGDSTIRNLIINGDSVTSTSTAFHASTGALAGSIGIATVDNVSVLGINITVDGDTTGFVHVGGLAGYNGGIITNSYATGNVDGGDRDDGRLRIGGLVGSSDGTITNSYATGSASGGDGAGDRVGGLVGLNEYGRIFNSYATGSASGGAGNYDYVGGLVGYDESVIITNSYATGSADGGAGNYDYVGGLAGINIGGRIFNSYATGDVDGGAGTDDYGGRLLGWDTRGIGTIANSYSNSEAVVANAENTVASGAAEASDGDPKTKAELRSLTPGTLDTGTNPNGAGVGWTSDNWAGMDDVNVFPTIRSFTDSDDDGINDGEGVILCGQDDIYAYCTGDSMIYGTDCIAGYGVDSWITFWLPGPNTCP